MYGQEYAAAAPHKPPAAHKDRNKLLYPNLHHAQFNLGPSCSTAQDCCGIAKAIIVFRSVTVVALNKRLSLVLLLWTPGAGSRIRRHCSPNLFELQTGLKAASMTSTAASTSQSGWTLECTAVNLSTDL